MSRRIGLDEGYEEQEPWTPEEALAIEQSLDMQMIEHVKELLCALWKQGRITIDTRVAGDSALGAALRAVAQPAVRNLTLKDGLTYSNDQWLHNQRSTSREF